MAALELAPELVQLAELDWTDVSKREEAGGI